MARCEDCIHNEICERFAELRTLVCGCKAEERCKMFKPTADVVEVVRCKDCIYSKFNSSNETYKCDRRGYYTENVDPEDYCSKGERADEG